MRALLKPAALGFALAALTACAQGDAGRSGAERAAGLAADGAPAAGHRVYYARRGGEAGPARIERIDGPVAEHELAAASPAAAGPVPVAVTTRGTGAGAGASAAGPRPSRAVAAEAALRNAPATDAARRDALAAQGERAGRARRQRALDRAVGSVSRDSDRIAQEGGRSLDQERRRRAVEANAFRRAGALAASRDGPAPPSASRLPSVSDRMAAERARLQENGRPTFTVNRPRVTRSGGVPDARF